MAKVIVFITLSCFSFRRTLLLLGFCCIPFLSISQTSVQKTPVGYTFIRNGSPYYVKGVGGEVNLDKAVAIGANSIRTWGIENAQSVLDEAQKRGLTVMLGMWLQHERHGFDYNDTAKVRKQFDFYKSIVLKYKDHPALLMWGVGNELDLQYTNTNVWYAVQDLAKFIHENDPNHPTSTVTAGLDSSEVRLITERAPDIDVYCVNTYGDIANVPANIEKFGWHGPYMITEWGCNGYWESPTTSWKVSLEQTSTEKKQVFYDRYNNYIAASKDKCLGSYAFLWGAKQEYTETWFGLFSKDNLPTEPVDALESLFTGKAPVVAGPTIERISLDGKSAKDNIHLKAGNKYNADVLAAIAVNMKSVFPDTAHSLSYRWKILKESSDKKSGGDKEEEAAEVDGGFSNVKAPQVSFRVPEVEGAYRLFVNVYLNGKVAYANIPFYADKRTEAEGQSRFIEFKRQSMDSFRK
jgi:Glycosyl hydrolases family 2, TIM barrel domain